MKTVFETIKDRLPITEVLTTYITLIPAGGQFKAKCPFHNEKTASFSVSPERGLYYCFGCGAKGDIFNFVEQFEGLDKRGALKVLADRAGVILTQENIKREDTDPLYEVLENTAKKYQELLIKNTEALKYLKDRGLTEETIKEFRIGYAPDEWKTISSGLSGQSEISIAERAGLIKKVEDGRYYDRFRKRIMFPMNDSSGRVVGFSGRIFPDQDGGDGPKYLNSPETELFQKSKILYGFDKAKLHIRKNNFAILVEGQFDMVISHQAGFRNTVATSGTAVSDMSISDSTTNLSVISRLTPNIFLAFDGDKAGQKALDRAALVSLGLNMNPKVVPVPVGLDPADYITKEGAENWKELIKKSLHFIIHEASKIGSNKQSPHTIVSMMRERLFPYLKSVPSPVEQSLYIESISKELNIKRETVADEFNMFLKNSPLDNQKLIKKIDEPETSVTFDERLSALAICYPSETVSKEITILKNLEFRSQRYSLPEMTNDRKQLLISTIERDYNALNNEERDSVCLELVAKVRDHFFLTLLSKYTKELDEAERNNNEEQVSLLLTTLQEINRLRQPKEG